LFFLSSLALGQTKKNNTIDAKHNPKIAVEDILGNWHSKDSIYPPICFMQFGSSFVEIIGLKHGVGNYSFHVYGDSIDVHGLAVNWPPYDCRLKLLNKNVLEIAFYQFHLSGETKVIYTKGH
jgi:hypothetical protein